MQTVHLKSGQKRRSRNEGSRVIEAVIVFSVVFVCGLSWFVLHNSDRTTIDIKEENSEQKQPVLERRARNGTYSILVDKETGVCYLEHMYMYHYGLTVMLNSDGTPRIWREEE